MPELTHPLQITYVDREEVKHYGERAKTTQALWNEPTPEMLQKFREHIAQLRGIPTDRIVILEVK